MSSVSSAATARSQRSLLIVELPAEVLVKILSNLQFKDIGATRRVTNKQIILLLCQMISETQSKTCLYKISQNCYNSYNAVGIF